MHIMRLIPINCVIRHVVNAKIYVAGPCCDTTCWMVTIYTMLGKRQYLHVYNIRMFHLLCSESHKCGTETNIINRKILKHQTHNHRYKEQPKKK